jgi:hypothetical protein
LEKRNSGEIEETDISLYFRVEKEAQGATCFPID